LVEVTSKGGFTVVTMADIAVKAGVSVSTVSHVLNDTRPVSTDLRRRVQAAISESGYSPSLLARSLATATTSLIGVVMSATSNPFFGEVFRAMDAAARKRGFNVLLADSGDKAAIEATQVKVMLDYRVAGIVLAPAVDKSNATLDLLAHRDVPTVLVDRLSDDRFDAVGPENVDSTALLVGHLAGLGHTRIGFVEGQRGLATTEERLAGYRAGLQQAGFGYDRRLVQEGRSQFAPARAAVLRLLAQANAPTAIVSSNNAMTFGVLRALRESHVQVPDDMAVVGFDDVEYGEFISPQLTVISQPIKQIGVGAVELLLDRMRNPMRAPRQRRIPTSFVHRVSCGCHDPGPAAAAAS
jgi:LacI family transcriptional regulator